LCVSKMKVRFRRRSPTVEGLYSRARHSAHRMRSALFLALAPSLVIAVNDYNLTATGKDCPASGRIPLPCGGCGPNWGDLKACEEQCNALQACTDITFYSDNGCRIYSSCNLDEAPVPDVQTTVYHRNNPSVVTRADGPCDIFGKAGNPCVAAHSVVRALYKNYTGPLYRVIRDKVRRCNT
jgi:hypothetical protein